MRCGPNRWFARASCALVARPAQRFIGAKAAVQPPAATSFAFGSELGIVVTDIEERRQMQITSMVDPNGAEFRTNAAAMQGLIAELDRRRAEAALGGPPRARERHAERGKLLPRDRVMH